MAELVDRLIGDADHIEVDDHPIVRPVNEVDDEPAKIASMRSFAMASPPLTAPTYVDTRVSTL